jgi:hypothetical protein
MDDHGNKIYCNFLNLSNIENIIKNNLKLLRNYDEIELENYFYLRENQEYKKYDKNTIKIIDLMLNNDGSMTNFLKVLVEKNTDSINKKMNMNLIQCESFNQIENKEVFESNNYLYKIMMENFLFELSSKIIIKRVIEFYIEEKGNEKNIIMYGISFWNEDKYNSLYSSDKEKNIPLGLILRQKKIEFYRETNNYCIELNLENENYRDLLILRISKYYNNQQLYFFLIETFQIKKLFNMIQTL